MLIIAIPLAPWRSGQHPKQVFIIVIELKIAGISYKKMYSNINKLFLDYTG